MKLTAELSLYPLQEHYIAAISEFIDHLRVHDDLLMVSNAMSTQVCGDFDRVLEVVGRELRASYERHGRQVLVCKFIPGELDIR
jgi:uncharacterized protein YqgV (UPF0045/DUF77 family)